jgi:DNA-binding NarL/FixJ family response regulator
LPGTTASLFPGKGYFAGGGMGPLSSAAEQDQEAIMAKKPGARGKRGIGILLVGEHSMVCAGLAQLINQEAGLSVCGQAGNAREAFESIATLKPDMVIVSISLKGNIGLEFIKEIRLWHVGLPVLVLSVDEESFYAERALRAGARGYIQALEAPDKLIQAIRRIMKGEVYVSEQLSERMLQKYINSGRAKHYDSPTDILTDRELTVLQLLGQGHKRQEIAASLKLSAKTVDTHLAHMLRKLALKNSTELRKYAVQWVLSGEKGWQRESDPQSNVFQKGPQRRMPRFVIPKLKTSC